MKKFFKDNIYIVLFLLLTIFYFEYSVTVLWDSAHYMTYVNILEGVLPWDTWDVVRGPIFPLIIHVGNILFGKSAQGLVMNTYMYYLIMLVFSYKLLDYYFDSINILKKKKNLWISIIMFVIVINPIIFGFCHSLLTEFVAITLSVLSCYLAVLWIDCDYKKDTKKYLFLSLYFIIFTVISWFLKQPYVSVSLFVIIVACLVSVLEIKSLKNTFARIGVVLACIVFLIVCMSGWNSFLRLKGNNPDTDRNPTNSLGNQLIIAVDFLKINNNFEEISDQHYINFSKLSDREKKEVRKLIKKNKEYLIVDYYNGKNVSEADYLTCNDGNVSTMSAVKYILSVFVRHPIKIIDSYLTNYLSLIDIYSTHSDDGIQFNSNKKIDLMFSSEIEIIAFRPYHYGSSNIFYMLPEMQERVSNYEQANYTFKGLNFIMRYVGKMYLLLFKLLFLILPILFITSILMRIFSKKKNNNRVYNLVIVLFGFSFLHVMLHVVTGAIIDRYIVPVFIPVFLGTFMLFFFFFKKEKRRG